MDNIEGVATVSVPKSKAVFQTGKKKGKLRKGCRFAGRGVRCSPAVAARLGMSKGKAKGSRKGSRKGRSPMNLTPKTAQGAQNRNVFLALQANRTAFRKVATTCDQKRQSGRNIILALRYMMALPQSGKLDRDRRNKRYHTEMERVHKETISFCKNPSQGGRSVSWKQDQFAGHPCASPKPPAWCNKKRKR